ncbi:MAG: DUF4118 domain-containing protein, partial [Dehalococcoidia bacterium]
MRVPWTLSAELPKMETPVPAVLANAAHPIPLTVLLRLGTALGLTSIAVLLKLSLGSAFIQSPFLVFFAAIMLSARAGGLTTGLLACAFAVGSIDYFFLPPALSLTIADPSRLAELLLFVLESLLIVWLTASLHAERRSSAAYVLGALEALRQEREALAKAEAERWRRVVLLLTRFLEQTPTPGLARVAALPTG